MEIGAQPGMRGSEHRFHRAGGNDLVVGEHGDPVANCMQAVEIMGDHEDCEPERALQRRDFKRDINDPEKVERYQAEALVHRVCPVSALLGIGFYDEGTARSFDAIAKKANVSVKLQAMPQWYF